MNAFTRKAADELRAEDVLVNAVCPRWIATDMGGAGGGPVEDGAARVVWAATLPAPAPPAASSATGGRCRGDRVVHRLGASGAARSA
ncbi:hypothetical protein [Streptomyces sp. NPDC059909]|uniref:hypothetical protein n=1 Tax=Streptomyces sp. NPDC059909 TaxID=3346998 RepID=UPI00364F0394